MSYPALHSSDINSVGQVLFENFYGVAAIVKVSLHRSTANETEINKYADFSCFVVKQLIPGL